RKARPPHRFTKDELQILKQAFEENPYPTFTTKQELAKQLHCHLYVIQNWFQDRRYRLPPREKKRL
ncbi:Double homeobox protein A, partial [Heterocephalus glaber]